MSGRGERLRYLPGLDGLRAVAVVAVMLYHGGVGSLPGGFLGVDVFFALSGFLITSLLLAEWGHTGRIALGAFWMRRARRLLPALVVLILAVVLWAWLVADTDLLSRVRRDGLATLLYVSNWSFVTQGQSYFDQFATPSPFRHTWSLAIEEQFYLIFPFVFIVAMRLLRRRRWIALFFAAASLVSATLMSLLTKPGADPSRIYFGTDTRLQTLLVGAVLAVAISGRPVPAWARPVANIAAITGAAVVLAFFLLVQDSAEWMYRGGFLVLALASTAVIAGITLAPRSPIDRILSLRPLVAVGMISYGLYLWHWPVFLALEPSRVGFTGVPLLLLRVLVTAVIAAASFRFVEMPIRRGALGKLKPGQRVAAISAAALATVAALLLATVSAQANPLSNFASGQSATLPGPDSGSATPAGATKVFLGGDSVAFNLGYYLPESMRSTISLAGETRIGCGLAAMDIVVDDTDVLVDQTCSDWPERWRQKIASSQPDSAIVSVGPWELHDHRINGKILRVGTPEYGTYLEGILTQAVAIAGSGGASVFLTNVPCMQSKSWVINGKDLSRDRNSDIRRQAVNDVIARVAQRVPHLTVLDVESQMCASGSYSDPNHWRSDGVHYTAEGAAALWKWIAPQLPPPPIHSTSGPSTSVFLLGDSQAFTLANYLPAELGSELTVTDSTQFGCSVLGVPLIADGKAINPLPACLEWIKRQEAEAAKASADVGVLAVGSWEQFDRVDSGQVLTAGSPEWRTALTKDFIAQLAMLHRHSKSVAILLDHCHSISDFGIGPEPSVINSVARVAMANQAARAAAKAAGFPVTVLDLNSYLCPAGFEPTRDGVQLRGDGLHLTPDGARLVWQWLLPQLRRMTTRP
ncbi:MAG: SGNH hydrolase domain-containing protein [Actinobacteria bacterium]|nr:SGNH hydrolase domain-containing protein [Actinomycetota bacterium]